MQPSLQPLIAINVGIRPSLNLGGPLSLGPPQQNSKDSFNSLPVIKTLVYSMQTTNSDPKQVGSGFCLQPPISIKVNTLESLSSKSQTMINTQVEEQEAELDLRDLESSDEEDISSAGPSGGCTGEP